MLPVLRSIAAVIAGYLVMVIVVILATGLAALAFRMRPDAAPGAVYLAVNLAYSGLAAMAGGYLCARLAPLAPMAHALVLAALILAASAAAFALAGGQAAQPEWYPLAIGVVGALGTAAGGRLLVARRTARPG